ncbi:resistin-like beta [Meriones unguiculatus]|uniref:resistin-like beta n=1 Tax=Meriones unguiculatus TaxID=10047 RepID=UPI00293F380A|nr:resistin-like beta [Meriones unguiculatus]
MKTTTFSFLIFISLVQLMVPVSAEWSFHSLVEKLKESFLNLEYPPFNLAMNISCTSIKATGRLASCPAGMAVTGCACGYTCGAWDIQNGNTCHCQCPTTDWTTASCCQLA